MLLGPNRKQHRAPVWFQLVSNFTRNFSHFYQHASYLSMKMVVWVVFHLEGVDEAQKISGFEWKREDVHEFSFAIDLFTSSDFSSLRIDLESTLRSNWNPKLHKLRGCKTQKVFKKISIWWIVQLRRRIKTLLHKSYVIRLIIQYATFAIFQ